MFKVKYRSPELKEKRRKFFKRLIISCVICFILVVGGIIFALRMDKIQIKEIKVSETHILNSEVIKSFVENSIQGSYLWVIPKTNTLLYSTSKEEKSLLDNFPGIENVTVSREGLQTLSILIKERKPDSIWCAEGVGEDLPDCYFVDATGVLFSLAPHFSGNVYFVYRGNLREGSPLGAQILSKEDFTKFQQFLLSIKKLNLNITSVLIKEAGDFEFSLSSGTKILFNSSLSYDNIFTNLDSVLKSGQLASTTLDKIDYVDLRFGNKVFFKAK